MEPSFAAAPEPVAFREIAMILRIEAARAKRDLALLDEFIAGLEGGPFPGTRHAHAQLMREGRALLEAADLVALLIPHEAVIRALTEWERRRG